jgi:hypothetical protein
LITSVEQLEIKGAFSMETKQPKLMTSRAEVVVAVLAVVVSIAAGSAVLAQDPSVRPSATAAGKPPVADKMEMSGGGSGMMGMGSDGNSMMGMGAMMGMKAGMEQMKCCGQGMGHADHGAGDKQDEKK